MGAGSRNSGPEKDGWTLGRHGEPNRHRDRKGLALPQASPRVLGSLIAAGEEHGFGVTPPWPRVPAQGSTEGPTARYPRVPGVSHPLCRGSYSPLSRCPGGLTPLIPGVLQPIIPADAPGQSIPPATRDADGAPSPGPAVLAGPAHPPWARPRDSAPHEQRTGRAAGLADAAAPPRPSVPMETGPGAAAAALPPHRSGPAEPLPPLLRAPSPGPGPGPGAQPGPFPSLTVPTAAAAAAPRTGSRRRATPHGPPRALPAHQSRAGHACFSAPLRVSIGPFCRHSAPLPAPVSRPAYRALPQPLSLRPRPPCRGRGR